MIEKKAKDVRCCGQIAAPFFSVLDNARSVEESQVQNVGFTFFIRPD